MPGSLPATTALTSIADGASIVAADHRNNYAAIQAAVNALIAALGVTAKGDLLAASGAGALTNVALGATGAVLVADSTQPGGIKWVLPPGYEYAYAEKQTATTTVQTTRASSVDTIATCAAVTFDGATKVKVEAFVPEVFNSVVANFNEILLFEDGVLRAILGRVQDAGTAQGTACAAEYEFTPAAGSHTYSLRVAVSSGTGTFSAGSGTAAGFVPAFIRITKV